MSATTKIEWCDATVNHWAGCTAISPACDNCYAKRMAGRLWGTQWGPGEPRHQFAGAAEALRALDRKAQRLGRPLLVFHNSLSDFFDNEVPVQWRIAALRVMLDTPNLIHLLLTKRIGNAAAMLETAFRAVHHQREGWADNVPPNIWIGATIANQPEADRDVSKLIEVPAAKHFLSVEPMLGAIDVMKWLQPYTCADCGHHGSVNDCGPDSCDSCGEDAAFEGRDTCKACGADDQAARASCPSCGSHRSYEEDCGFIWSSERRLIDWVICGGESGPGARPMHPDWARSLRDQCEAAGVPFLFKQWGEHAPNWLNNDAGNKIEGSEWIDRMGKKAAGRLLDGRTHDGFPGVTAP